MITDVIMPGMNGYQLADEVGEKYPEIKIIIASGYNEVESKSSVKNIEYKYLDKPYRSQDLLVLIRELLN